MLRSSLITLVSIASLVTFSACNNTSTTDNATHSGSHPTTSPMVEDNRPKTDVDYMVSLGLMKGHLMVAKELINQGEIEQAKPHVDHPIDEIYGDLEGQLQEYNVEPFKPTLVALQEQIDANPKGSEMAADFDAAMKEIDQAIAALPQTQRQSPKFVLQAINGLLETAGSEYEAAIANNQISEAVEYQDSRGFVLYSDNLYSTIAQPMSQTYPEVDQAIKTDMAKLKKAWPTAMAPKTPAMPPTEVSQLVTNIKSQSDKVTQ